MKFVFGLLPHRTGQDYRGGGHDTQTRISIWSNRIIKCATDHETSELSADNTCIRCSLSPFPVRKSLGCKALGQPSVAVSADLSDMGSTSRKSQSCLKFYAIGAFEMPAWLNIHRHCAYVEFLSSLFGLPAFHHYV
jgi:hypothetical protein